MTPYDPLRDHAGIPPDHHTRRRPFLAGTIPIPEANPPRAAFPGDELLDLDHADRVAHDIERRHHRHAHDEAVEHLVDVMRTGNRQAVGDVA